MRWSTAAVVVGLLLLAGGFALATDAPVTVTVDGREHRCASVLAPGVLVPGAGSRGQDRTPRDRGVEAACAPRERVVRRVVGGVVGLGSLVLLVGWTATRERGTEDVGDEPWARPGDLHVSTGAKSR